MRPVIQFTKGLSASNRHLANILFTLIRFVCWSGHNFAHVVSAQLLWHVQNCNLGPISQSVFHHSLNLMEILFYSLFNAHEKIVTKFGSRNDSWAVLTYAKIYCNFIELQQSEVSTKLNLKQDNVSERHPLFAFHLSHTSHTNKTMSSWTYAKWVPDIMDE